MTPTLIKALEDLKAFFVKQAEQPALKSATLADGTEIKYAGDLVTGTAVTMVTPDGEVPAQGDLTLADGTIVKCEAGIVTEVIAPTDMKTEQAAPTTDPAIAELTAKVDTLLQLITQLTGGMEEEMTQKDKVMQALQSEVETLKAKPAAKPIFVPADSTDEFLNKEVERVKSIQSKAKK